jgi:hypothetical protein
VEVELLGAREGEGLAVGEKVVLQWSSRESSRGEGEERERGKRK